ncbi:hypothetical protein Tco_1044190, partial [Tanacetum coccineum]
SYGYRLQDPVIRYQMGLYFVVYLLKIDELLKIDVVRRWDSDAVDVVLSLLENPSSIQDSVMFK